MYELTNGAITIHFEPLHGNIVRFSHNQKQIELVGEPGLAENFRILLPLPGLHAHYIFGKNQTLDSFLLEKDRAIMIWKGLASEQGMFPIEVKMTVELEVDDATFSININNQSELIVEEVFTPALGGMSNPLEIDDWNFQFHTMWKSEEWKFYKEFPYKFLSNTWFNEYNSMPWCDLYNVKRRTGVYIGNHDLEPRYSMIMQQLYPNIAFDNRWPDPDEVDDGVLVGATLAWVSFPFVAPGNTWQGPQIVFHFHDGIWYEAADYYRKWFDRNFPFDKSKSWLYHEDAWQSTIIHYPNGTADFTFKDLPEIARNAKEFGINVIQIDGWNNGGIDRNYPDYSPSPRLGTTEELKAAIKECQDMGMHFLLFNNLQVASMENELFNKELHKYVLKDYWGTQATLFGYGFHTALELTGHATHKMAYMDVSTGFKQVIIDQMKKMAGYGADGMQIDKTCEISYLSFSAKDDKDVAYRRGMIEILREIKDFAGSENESFQLATEARFDRFIPYVDAGYIRHFFKEHIPVFEYVFPEYRMTNCMNAIDYGLVNNCVRYGHIINMEAKNLQGTCKDERKLSAYIKEVLKIRRELKDVLWYGRLAELRGIGTDNEKVVHSLFVNGDRNALVLTHFEREDIQVKICCEAMNTKTVRIYQPYKNILETVGAPSINIPKNCLAVIVWDNIKG